MRCKTVWMLALLNVVLLTVLAWRQGWVGEPEAVAQAGRPSEYLMIPGRVSGASGSVVYILDPTRQELSAAYFDPNKQTVDFMPPLDLTRIFQAGAGVMGPAPGRPQPPARP